MSYNISSTRYLSGQLYIRDRVVCDLMNKHEDELPEGNFLVDLWPDEGDVHGHLLRMSGALWYGEGSGRSSDLFLLLLGETEGRADILVCYEGGDSYTGIRVEDGVVTERRVEFVLGDRL